jgi:two-component system phosphate regulon sensor histidine kinase PhoR
VSLRTKIVLSYLILFGAILLIATFYTTRLLRQNLVDRLQGRIAGDVDLLGNVLYSKLIQRPQIDAVIKELGKDLDVKLMVFDPLGTVVADSELSSRQLPYRTTPDAFPEVFQAAESGFADSRSAGGGPGTGRLSVAKRIEVPWEQHGWVILRVSSSLDEVNDEITEMLWILYGSDLATFLLLVICSLWLGGRITGPLTNMTRMAQRMAEGDFRSRIHHYPNDEIGALGRSMDQMARQLESTIQRLNEETGQLSSVFRGMIEGVMVVNKEGEIVMVNETLKEFFPQTREFTGMMPLAAIRNTQITEGIREALNGKEVFDREITRGSPRNECFRANIVPLRIDDEVGGCIVVFHDVTKLKRLEEVRKDFVANVSHEIRTPLTTIKGYAETLLEDPPDDIRDQRRFLSLILKNSNRLSSLTEDLLKLSAIDAERWEAHRAYVEVESLFRGLAQSFARQAEAKSLALTFDCTPKALRVYADSRSLNQILSNLVENAVKYTQENGAISVSAREESHSIHFLVRDTGIGIPQRDLERVFERFYRVDKERSRDIGGTGLGLAIVKNLVQAEGGKVRAESRLGKGTTFHVSLPKPLWPGDDQHPEITEET